MKKKALEFILKLCSKVYYHYNIIINPIQTGLKWAVRKTGGNFAPHKNQTVRPTTLISICMHQKNKKVENCFRASNFKNRKFRNRNSEMKLKMKKNPKCSIKLISKKIEKHFWENFEGGRKYPYLDAARALVFGTTHRRPPCFNLVPYNKHWR